MKYRTILTVEILHDIEVNYMDLRDLHVAESCGEIECHRVYGKSKQVEEGEE